MNVHRHHRHASVLQVLAVFSGIVLAGVGLIALLVYRTITVGGDIRSVRGAVMKDMGVKCTSKVEVSAHPWLVGLARLGLSLAPLDPDARLAIQSIRGAEVGVYHLASDLDVRERHELFNKVTTRMEERDWDRAVTVMNRDQLVMVFTPDEKMNPNNIEAFVFVLNGRELVLVSGKGTLEPILELMSTKMGEHMSAPLVADWRH